MCIIPYATQQGEISFCAYNTGVGWRQIVEKMHMTATLVKWYEEHGRHEIFANGKSVPLASTAHSLTLDPAAVNASAQTDLDELSIPKTAREERLAAGFKKRFAREKSNRGDRAGVSAEDATYHQNMANLYRQHVLKEQPTVQIQRLNEVKGK